MPLSEDRAGTWTGENAFRLLPADVPHRAPATAVVQVSGAMTTVAYTWEHPDDGPQAGLLALGPAGAPAAADPVVALWGDSWHQAPEARVLSGHVQGGVAVVSYDHAPGAWRWEVALVADSEALALRMDSVPLDGGGERHSAMTATFTRA